MDEYDRAVSWQHNVGTSRQLALMKPKPETLSVKRSPQGQFGLRITTPNAGHHAGAHGAVYNVGQ